MKAAIKKSRLIYNRGDVHEVRPHVARPCAPALHAGATSTSSWGIMRELIAADLAFNCTEQPVASREQSRAPAAHYFDTRDIA